MSPSTRTPIAFVVLAAAVGPCLAQTQSPATPAAVESNTGVKVGDPAPGIGTPTWGYGEGVKSLEPERVYAIVFEKALGGVDTAWAPETDIDSVCAAAATMLPRDAGSVILVRGCSPTGPNARFKPGAFGFAVACGFSQDVRIKWLGDKPRWTATAIIVDRHLRIAWIGDVADMPFVLEEVRAGRFDAATFEKSEREYHQHMQAARAAARKGNASEARSNIEAAIAILRHRRAIAEAWWFDMVFGMEVRSSPEVRGKALRVAAQRVFDAATLSDTGAVESTCIRLSALQPEANIKAALDGEKRLIELSGMNDWRCLDAAARLHAQLSEWNEAIKTAALALSAAPEDKRPLLNERIEAYGEKRMPKR